MRTRLKLQRKIDYLYNKGRIGLKHQKEIEDVDLVIRFKDLISEAQGFCRQSTERVIRGKKMLLQFKEQKRKRH